MARSKNVTFRIVEGGTVDPFGYVMLGDVIVGRITGSVDAEDAAHNVMTIRIPAAWSAPRYVEVSKMTAAQSAAFKAACDKGADILGRDKANRVRIPRGAWLTDDSLYVTAYSSKYGTAKIAARVPLSASVATPVIPADKPAEMTDDILAALQVLKAAGLV